MQREVAIIGAGVGGLTLAQGLTQRGIEASVYERDMSPEFRAQGYRVTLRPSGIDWLRGCLPAENFELLLQASQPWSGMNLLSKELAPLLELHEPKDPMRSIDRLTLHRILLRGIEPRVHFGKTFLRYEEHSDHVDVHFSDRQHTQAMLLVGADGHQSRVRRTLLPEHAELADTGQRDLAGKIPLTAETRELMRALQVRSISIVTTIDGPTMVLIPQEFGDAIGANASRASQTPPQDYLYWGLVAPRERYAPLGAAEPTDPAQLKRLAHEVTRDWHPLFHQLIELTPPTGLQLLVFRSSVPHGPWNTGRVTLLGDAVHAMVPMRGEGANTAIRDAGALCASLSRVKRGETLSSELARYEAEMLKYGFGKVRQSLSSLEMFVSGPKLKRRAMHGVLHTIQRGRQLLRGAKL